MPTPASGPISMGDVSTEIGSATETMSNYYTISLGGGNGLGQYHNLTMGPGNNLTYKTAIYDPRSLGASGENMKLGNYYNYYQGPTGIFGITLTNTCSDNDVFVDLYVADPYSSPITYLPVWGPNDGPNGSNTRYDLAVNNGSNFVQTDVAIEVLMTTGNFPNGVYVIYADFSAFFYSPPPPPPPAPPPSPTTVSGSGNASDTDNVGAGLVRSLNGGGINFDAANAIFKVPIVTGNIPGGTGIGIFVNKRTTFDITFTS